MYFSLFLLSPSLLLAVICRRFALILFILLSEMSIDINRFVRRYRRDITDVYRRSRIF